MENKITKAKREIIDYLKSQKEPENSNRFHAEYPHWFAFNEAIDIAIEEVKDVLNKIEHDVEFKRGSEFKPPY